MLAPYVWKGAPAPTPKTNTVALTVRDQLVAELREFKKQGDTLAVVLTQEKLRRLGRR